LAFCFWFRRKNSPCYQPFIVLKNISVQLWVAPYIIRVSFLWIRLGIKNARRPVSRVLSAPVQNKYRTGTTIPLGRASLRASRDQPGRRGGNAPASRVRLYPSAPPATPIRSCSRWGLPCRPCCQGRGALLPHRFTRAGWPCGEPAVCFLWHFPWGRPRRPLTGTVFPWSPDFPPPWPGRQRSRRRGQDSGRPAVWHRGDARRGGPGQATAARTARSRVRVAASASPVTAPGNQ
jgi:hypothetical protein